MVNDTTVADSRQFLRLEKELFATQPGVGQEIRCQPVPATQGRRQMNRPLTLYYRSGCHLCEQMLAEIYALHGDGLQLHLVDVDTDDALQTRYGLQVPVLVGGTAVLSMGKLDWAALEEYLTAG